MGAHLHLRTLVSFVFLFRASFYWLSLLLLFVELHLFYSFFFFVVFGIVTVLLCTFFFFCFALLYVLFTCSLRFSVLCCFLPFRDFDYSFISCFVFIVWSVTFVFQYPPGLCLPPSSFLFEAISYCSFFFFELTRPLGFSRMYVCSFSFTPF